MVEEKYHNSIIYVASKKLIGKDNNIKLVLLSSPHTFLI